MDKFTEPLHALFATSGDTRIYVKDCQIIFGHYLHYSPHFGSRRAEDRRQLERDFANTRKLFKIEFDVDI